MKLAKCYLCDAPFAFRGNGVYSATCDHDQGNRCAVCGEGEAHHVGGAVKACHGGIGTVFCRVTSPANFPPPFAMGQEVWVRAVVINDEPELMPGFVQVRLDGVSDATVPLSSLRHPTTTNGEDGR